MRVLVAFLLLCATCSAAPLWPNPELNDQTSLLNLLSDNGVSGRENDEAYFIDLDSREKARELEPQSDGYLNEASDLQDLKENLLLLRAERIMNAQNEQNLGKRAGKSSGRGRKGSTRVFRWGK